MKTRDVSSTTASERWAEIAASLSDKSYRDAFVEQEIRIGVPFQIRALRLQRDWSQKSLGQEAGGIAQETISLLENPTYGRMNIGTLLRLASAFDVGLMLRFVPFSDLVDRAANVSPRALRVPSYADDARLAQPAEEVVTIFSSTSEAVPIMSENSAGPKAMGKVLPFRLRKDDSGARSTSLKSSDTASFMEARIGNG